MEVDPQPIFFTLQYTSPEHDLLGYLTKMFQRDGAGLAACTHGAGGGRGGKAVKGAEPSAIGLGGPDCANEAWLGGCEGPDHVAQFEGEAGEEFEVA